MQLFSLKANREGDASIVGDGVTGSLVRVAEAAGAEGVGLTPTG